MMKNASLFALLLAVLACLPGCWGRKRAQTPDDKKGRVEKVAALDMPLADDSMDMASADESIKSLFDQDMNEFVVDRSAQSNGEYAMNEQDEDGIKTIHFDYDKSAIRPDQKEVLAKNIEKLKKIAKEAPMNPTFVIEGHCDEVGSPAYNMALSEDRAKKIADKLTVAGIKNLKTVGFGNNRPVVQTGAKDERNRRVEVHVVYS